jgi:uncharacterized protein YaiL (DUF2058 family)
MKDRITSQSGPLKQVYLVSRLTVIYPVSPHHQGILMASLQDQLLKAGLVDKNKANKANKEKQKKAKAARGSGATITNEASAAAQREQAKKAERDRQLNLKKQRESIQKAVTAQIIQLVEMNRLDTGNGEIDYSFIFDNKVKKINLSEELKDQLVAGRLAIVTIVKNQQRKYEIVPAQVAEKIAQRDTSCIVQLNEKEDSDDDAYADYKIPDDLMW